MRLDFTRERCTIVDLGSPAGIYINDLRRPQRPYPLAGGDKVMLGGLILRAAYEGEEELPR